MKTSLLASMVPVSFSLIAFASSALAADNPCGKFDFSSGVSCEIKVSGGCKTECTPVHFQTVCNGSCTAQLDVACATTCQSECLTQCKPGSIDCKASCNGECQSHCNAACDHGDCASASEASCAADCEASCKTTPPSCEVNCQESCNGACTAAANINCNVDCYSQTQGGCETQCDKPSGALFCNGEYVGADDIDACITYIENNWNGKVDVSARGEVTCDANGCEGSGTANGHACSISSADATTGGLGAFALLGLASCAGALARRRRAGR